MINTSLKVQDIREMFKRAYENGDFVIDKSGVKTIEIIGATFIADEDHIIREPSYEYIKRELTWYKSMSLYVKDIPGKTPKIWEAVSDKNGKINSNYGWCIWAKTNYSQYYSVMEALIKNPNSRQAIMIYNRPSMHEDFCKDGMSDFICTYANSFMIRGNKLHSHYLMRSNDAIMGYNNDYAWAKYVQNILCEDLQFEYPGLEIGELIWTASNIHVYERHFSDLEKMIKGI